MLLIIRSGSAAGTTIEVTTEFVIGRDGDCDLVLDDDKVSRRHAMLRPLADRGLSLKDLGSRNGTYVNGRRIESNVTLDSHAIVQIGDTILEADRGAVGPDTRSPASTVAGTQEPGTVVSPHGLWLELGGGDAPPRRIEATGRRFLIGRARDCHLMLTDARVSHRHAFLTVLGPLRALVTDLDSRNGTFVNGRRITEPTEVGIGDILGFGETSVSVTSGPAGTEKWPTLGILAGQDAGGEIPVSVERFVVGRDDSCDLVLDDPQVSRHHAALRPLPQGRLLITDLESRNGVFVDGRRIAEPTAAGSGTRLRIGSTDMELHMPGETSPTARRRASIDALAAAATAHPLVVVAGWVALLVVGVLVTAHLLTGSLHTGDEAIGMPESKKGDALLAGHLPATIQPREIAIISSPTLRVSDEAFQHRLTQIRRGANALGRSVVQPSSSKPTRSPDGHSATLQFTMAGGPDEARKNVDLLASVVHNAAGGGFHTGLTGTDAMHRDLEKLAEHDLKNGDAIGLGIAVIVLVVVFGALVAVALPVLLSVATIVVTLGITAILAQVVDLSFFVKNMVFGMSFALGIDYSLFVLTRYREERTRGRTIGAAIIAAEATSGRAVLFSGTTVVLALVGMLIVPDTVLRSLGLGAILATAVSVLAALSLLPALLAIVGDRVNALRLPFLANASEQARASGGFWSRVARGVMRHPVAALVVSVAILLILALPARNLTTGSSGLSTLPDSAPSKQGFLQLSRSRFPAGAASPAQVVIEGDVNSIPVKKAVANLRARLEHDTAFGPTSKPVHDQSGDVALVSVPLRGDPNASRSIDGVHRLRQQYIPRAFGGTEARVFVTGETASNIDEVDLTNSAMPYVFLFVLGLSFLVLMLAFRSIVVPIKAICLNLLSVGAAYGLLTLVFQEGVGADLLGFQKVDAVESWVPLFLFSILFGLSMDYHVFLLSRIRERFDHTGDNREAVAQGVESTARVITGAALIMVSVFSGFALGDIVMFQQMGFGLAVALLLDATIVRSVLVPASMTLLGPWNWYLPSWLSWLPETRVEG